MDILREELVRELFSVWAIYFSCSALVFCILTGLIVYWISFKITEPIVKLNARINLSI